MLRFFPGRSVDLRRILLRWWLRIALLILVGGWLWLLDMRSWVLLYGCRCCLILSCFLGLSSHGGFDFLQAHHLPSRRGSQPRCSSWRFLRGSLTLRRNTPEACIHLHIGNIARFLVTLIAASGWLGKRLLGDVLWLLGDIYRGGDLGNRLLTGKAKLLLIDRTRNLSSLSKEIKVLANRCSGFSYRFIASKGIIVEDIIRLVQLIAETIVCVLEVETRVLSLAVVEWQKLFALTHHHHCLLQVLKALQMGLRPVRSQVQRCCDPDRGVESSQSQRKTWRRRVS